MKHALALLLMAGTCSASGQWLSDSLIAHFPMDGSPDDTVQLLSPVVTSGSPTFCTDRFGNSNAAGCFDGGSFWSYGDVLDVDTADFSLAYWALLDTVLPPFYVSGTYLTDGSMLVCKGATVYGDPQRAGYALAARNYDGVFALTAMWGGANNDLVYDETPINLHDWFHVVQSRCGAHQILHINGQLVIDTITDANRDLETDIVFALGALDRDPTNHPDQGWLHGALDDLRIYKGRCLSQAEINVLADLTVGVHQPSEGALNLILSPNPATNSLRIMLPPMLDVSGPVQVYDATGRRMPVQADELTLDDASVHSMQLNVACLPQGAYFVVVPTDNLRMHGRFIKE